MNDILENVNKKEFFEGYYSIYGLFQRFYFFWYTAIYKYERAHELNFYYSVRRGSEANQWNDLKIYNFYFCLSYLEIT